MVFQDLPTDNMAPPKISWWRRIANRFWGYDFFISYHWPILQEQSQR
jgi:hypothetical protein